MSKQTNSTKWIGLDIGGANLKIADEKGNAHSRFFPLWEKREELTSVIRKLITDFGVDSNCFAMTMTGELADCYRTKQEGVSHIIDSTREAIGDAYLRIATVDDQWLPPETAKESTDQVAAANWRLSARYVAKQFTGDTRRILLLDIGSTTVDLIPIEAGKVISQGRTDTERLQTGELVYCGTRRTSVDSLVSELPYHGLMCPIMRERFATTADVWLLLGHHAEDSEYTVTADGKPLTIDLSIDRIARLVGADRLSFTADDAKYAAHMVADKQIELVSEAVQSQSNWPFDAYYLSGEGEFLAERVIEHLKSDAEIIRASSSVGAKGSCCGPAHAAAWLASREIYHDSF